MTITISIPNIVINISNNNPNNLNFEEMATHTLAELLQLATDQSTKEDSLLAIVTGLKTDLSDALAKAAAAGTIDPATIQAEVDQVFEKFTANTQKLADAITANTPDAGTPAPPVVTPDPVVTPAPVDPTPAPVDPTPAPTTGGDTTPPVDSTPTPDPVVDQPAPPVVDTPVTPGIPDAPGGVPTAPTPVTNPDGSTTI